MIRVAVLVVILTASPAFAEMPVCPCTITLTNQELQANAAMIDMAVKSRGMDVAEAAIAVMKKLQSAQPIESPKQPEAKQ